MDVRAGYRVAPDANAELIEIAAIFAPDRHRMSTWSELPLAALCGHRTSMRSGGDRPNS
jgi:hypothetical protein